MEIYKITNTVNGKIYIGQTVRNVGERFNEHCRHNNTLIDRAINKYGKDKFIVEVIASAKSQEELNELEIKYICEYKSMDKAIGYNLCEGGNNTQGYKHRKESKRKMSKSKQGKYTAQDNPFYGKHHSEEQRKKWSEQRKGRTLDEEWKDKIAKAGYKKVINLDTGIVYDSVKMAAESCGAPSTHITRVCKGKRKRSRGYRWAYAD